MRQPMQPSLFAERPETLSINALYNRVEGALARAFPRSEQLWVRGEIQSLSDRTGHCYFDMVDPDADRSRDAPVLKVRCWRSTWRVLAAELARQGVRLEPGLVVAVRGRVEIYRPRGELGFILEEVDVAALVGRLAMQRAALIEKLTAERVLGLNRSLVMARPPLAVGLIGSPDTEGYRDFLAQLESSGLAFSVTVVRTQVQGTEAPRMIAHALAALARAKRDVVVIVRGGGSKADLAAFDTEQVARAITRMPVPVWTGVGHTGDESVADLVAHRSLPTPTACALELVALVSEWWSEVVARAGVVASRSTQLVAASESRDLAARHRLARAAVAQLRARSERVAGCAGRVAVGARRAGQTSSMLLEHRASRAAQLVPSTLEREADRHASWRRLLDAYDPERQLDRGWTLTLDDEGRIVRSVAAVRPGAMLSTRFADGTVTSTVDGVRPAGVATDPPEERP